MAENLEDILEGLEFKFGGVLEKLADLTSQVTEQMEILKTAGVKIRRKNTLYTSGSILVCVGKANGSKCLKCVTAGTTGSSTFTEEYYNSLIVGNEYIDGGVVWECIENAFTTSSIVESALNASHAEIADYATSAGSATSAGYALSAGYQGPFNVVSTGQPEEPVIISGVTYGGISFAVQDNTRPIGTAGVIVNGQKTLPVPSSGGFLPEGKILYLSGSSAIGEQPNYALVWYLDGATPPTSVGKGEFLTALAKNEGGIVKQIQFGDIVTPWPGENNEEEYNGPFKMFITGSSSVISNSGTASATSSMKYNFEIYDPTSPINQTTNKHEWAGKIFAGEEYHQAGITHGILNVGDFVYLVGDYKSGAASFDYTNYIPSITEDGEDSQQGQKTITSAGFYVRIAQCNGGSCTQIQYGDITVPPWKVVSAGHTDSANYADSANHANYADSVDYKGPFHVVQSGNWIQVVDDSWPNTYGGAVIVGSSSYRIGSTAKPFQPGFRLYLQGTSNYDGNISLEYRYIQDGATISSLKPNQFLTPLAAITNGGIMQIQYGNITQPFHTEEYQGPFHITFEEKSGLIYSGVKVTDDIRNTGEDSSWAGGVVIGPSTYKVTSASLGELTDGAYVYLLGTFTSSIPNFLISQGLALPTLTNSQFLTILGKAQENKIIQTQFGDVVQPVSGGTSGVIQEEYNGPFKVSITGTTEGINTVDVSITDPTDSSINPPKAGRLFDGSSLYTLTSSSLGELADGAYVYLRGSWGSTPYFTKTSGNNNANQFCMRIAQNSGGEIIQIQRGDVYSIPFYTNNAYSCEEADHASTADFATSAALAGYRGPFHVSSYENPNDVKVFDDTHPGQNQGGTVVIGNSIYYPSSGTLTLNDGFRAYLIGTSTGGSMTFTYSSFQDGIALPSIPDSQFYAPLAIMINDNIIQQQFGNIIQPSFGGSGSSIIEDYEGPFKVSATSVNTSTYTANVTIYDLTDSTTPAKAGRVFDGSSIYTLNSSSTTLNNGDFLYLHGSKTENSGSFDFTTSSGTNSVSEFYTRLAYNSGGKIIQIQYGDIYSIPWKSLNAINADEAAHAINADSATIASEVKYYGPFRVSATNSAGTTLDVTINDPTDPSTNPYHAGRVFANESTCFVNSSSITGVSNGAFIYLIGDSTAGNISFSMSVTSPSSVAGRFVTRLAKNEGGKIIQIQKGDITVPPWNVQYASSASSAAIANTAINANSATNATYASSAGYQGPFKAYADSVAQDKTITATVSDTYTINQAGVVVDGATCHIITSSGGIQIADSGYLYLIGSSGNGGVTFNFSGTSPSSAAGQFVTRIAKNEGGIFKQIQFGDITDPAWNNTVTGVEKITVTGNATITPSTGTGIVNIDVPYGTQTPCLEPLYSWLDVNVATSNTLIACQPNGIYNIWVKNKIGDWNYDTQAISACFNQGLTPNMDGNVHEVDVVVKLPALGTTLSDSCMVEVYFWYNTAGCVIAPDNKLIIPNYDAAQGSTYYSYIGHEGNPGPIHYTFTYQPTPLVDTTHQTYTGGVWHMIVQE